MCWGIGGVGMNGVRVSGILRRPVTTAVLIITYIHIPVCYLILVVRRECVHRRVVIPHRELLCAEGE